MLTSAFNDQTVIPNCNIFFDITLFTSYILR